MKFNIEASGFQHQGSREYQQDSFRVGDQYWLVADGMGGYDGGELASKIVADTTAEFLKKHQEHGSNCEQVCQELEQLSETIVDKLDAAVDFDKGDHVFSNLVDMGSTLVFAYLHDGVLLIGNVGDSRAYGFYDYRFVQITQDHAYLDSHVLTRVFQAGRVAPKFDIFTIEVAEEDKYILCSDGFHNELSNHEISDGVEKLISENQLSAERLVSFASIDSAPAADNTTVIVIKIGRYV